MRLVPQALICVAIALVAAVPTSAAKAEKTAIRIKITMEGPLSDLFGPHDLNGGFRAFGAIHATGSASAPFISEPFEVLLVDDQGSLTVAVTQWTSFQLAGGTGAYEGLAGAGSASVDFTYLWPTGTTGKDRRYTEPDRIRVDLELDGTLSTG